MTNVVKDLNTLLEKTILDPVTGCFEWSMSCTSAGYGQLFYQGKNTYAHRLAYMMANGVYLGKEHFVCHKCDNPKCCNPKHLFLGTAKDNTNDMYSKGRAHSHHFVKGHQGGKQFTKGQPAHNASIDIETARNIKKAISESPAYKGALVKIAEYFGVSRDIIYSIKMGKSWVAA